MHRTLALTALMLASMVVQARPTLSAAQSGTTVTASGVTLSVAFAQPSYPLDALAQAVIAVTNHTDRPITSWDCPSSSLRAEVVAAGGVTLYPPLLRPPGAPWTACQGAVASAHVTDVLRIAPGQTVTRKTYVVLRALTVRAWADLRFQASQGKPVTVQTPLLHLGESTGIGPRIALHHGSPVEALVTAVPGGGPVLYSQFAYCRDGREHPMVAGAVFSRWTPTTQQILQPFHRPCASLAEWSLFVGQPGKPIAHAYFCAVHAFCAYAPPTPQALAVAGCKRDIARAVSTGQLPPDAARYAIGLAATPPGDLSPAQLRLAQAFHRRCAPALKLNKP